jgi:CBS domain-containing protein
MICPRCGCDNIPGMEWCANCVQDLAILDQPAGHDRVESSLLSDRVSALRPRRPVTVPASANVRDTVAVMIDEGVGAVLVVDAEGFLAGILSERDLLTWVADLPAAELKTHTVDEFMTPTPQTVTPGDPLALALQRMDVGRYRHLPVVEQGRPVGMISVRDLIRHITRLCRD